MSLYLSQGEAGRVMHERYLKKNKRVMQLMRWSYRNNTIFIFVGSRQAPSKNRKSHWYVRFAATFIIQAKDCFVMTWTLWCSWSHSEHSAFGNHVSQVDSKLSTACLLGLTCGHHSKFFEWTSHAILICKPPRSCNPLVKSMNDMPAASTRPRASYLQRNAATHTSVRSSWGATSFPNVKPQISTRPRSWNPSYWTNVLYEYIMEWSRAHCHSTLAQS